MPYKFVFKANNNTLFTCNLQCVQCKEIKSNGRRCSLKTCIGTPYCWIHLLHNKHLRILNSQVAGAGKGLFAISKQAPDNAILFRTGDVVIEYDGETISHNQLDRRYGDYTAPYALAHGRTVEDAACKRGIGSISNHSNRKRDSNVRYSLSRTTGRFRLIATKPIRNGHEILSHYGNEYRFDEPTSHHTRR